MELILPFIPKKLSRNSKGQFKKGHKPWNFGKQKLYAGGEKTQFKKGHLPHNTKFNGAISKRFNKRDNRYYLYIREDKGKWELLQRHIYKLHHGDIPKGYCIRFIDGNFDNISIENLECISRQENLTKNRNRQKAKVKLTETWRREKLRQKYGMTLKTKLLKQNSNEH